MTSNTSLRLLSLAGAVLALSACPGPAGDKGDKGDPGAAGAPCSITSNANGTKTITCADGTSATIANGTNGANGDAGANGTNCTVAPTDGGMQISCTDGTSVFVANGTNGTNGANGDAGLNGRNGGNVEITNFHGLAAIDAEELAVDSKTWVKLTITGATADATGRVSVNFTVMTRANVPVTNLTAASATIAKLQPAPSPIPAAGGEAYSKWIPYIYRTQSVSAADGGWPAPAGTWAIQATTDGAGTLTNNGGGAYTLVLSKNLATAAYPDGGAVVGYERNRTHRVAVMIGGHSGPTASADFDFVPDGSAITDRRDIVQTSACQQCHGPNFAAHGGDRMTTGTCTTCHAPVTVDPQSGNTVDFKVMIHKIHAGSDLASIAGPDGIVWDDPATSVDESADNGQYAIWGYADHKYEWWKVGFPAEIANCTKCHNGTGAQVDNWKNVPSRAVCGSCHDTVNFATGVNHPGGAQASDANCATCHQPVNSSPPLLISVTDAHDFANKDQRHIPDYLPEMTVSTPANGSYFVAGESPVVTIKLKDNDLAGHPYIDHTTFVADDAVTAVPPGDGPEGCSLGVLSDGGVDYTVACPPKDGKFTNSSFFVHGPRARRNPVLTTLARVVVKSTVAEPFNLTTASGPLGLRVDGAMDIYSTDVSGGDIVLPGSFTVPLSVAGASGEIALTPAPTTTSFTDANQQFLGSARTWRDHQLAGWSMKVTDNTVTGSQTVTVVDNVGALVTVTPALTLNLGHTLTYTTSAQPNTYSGQLSSASGTTLTDASSAWRDHQFVGFTLRILSGTGAGQTASIQDNVGQTLTLTAALATAPDATSIYMIQPIGDLTAATNADLVRWLNSNASFKARAIAYVEGNRLVIRSRNLGNFYSLQLTWQTATVASVIFPAEGLTATVAAPVHVIGSNKPGAADTKGTASTVANVIARQTDPTKNDPKVAWFTDRITYTLDPVDDLQPGTYIAKIELADRGTVVSEVNYKTPTVARVKFQVKQAAEEKAPATGCGVCHVTGNDDPATENAGLAEAQRGLVVDYMRHNKLLNNTAVDLCGNCHDYQAQNATGDWSGAVNIARRVHAVHRGSHLAYPNTTVSHADTVPGRNWDIEFPQDIRSCDVTCHSSAGPNATSGTWKTKPARLPCGGCHDSDANQAHFRAMTWDPTPAAPYSGDEIESCRNCHAP